MRERVKEAPKCTMPERESSKPLARVKDSRGRRVTQLDPIAMHMLHQHGMIEADVLRSIAHEQGVRVGVKERVALIAGDVPIADMTCGCCTPIPRTMPRFALNAAVLGWSDRNEAPGAGRVFHFLGREGSAFQCVVTVFDGRASSHVVW